jgi:hypothetical protein
VRIEPGEDRKVVKVMFQGQEFEVEHRHYPNGRRAIVLVDAVDREQAAVATVNLPDEPLAPDEVFIKDYSENAGMLRALEGAGVVRATGELVRSGFAEIPRAKVLTPEKSREPDIDMDR